MVFWITAVQHLTPQCFNDSPALNCPEWNPHSVLRFGLVYFFFSHQHIQYHIFSHQTDRYNFTTLLYFFFFCLFLINMILTKEVWPKCNHLFWPKPIAKVHAGLQYIFIYFDDIIVCNPCFKHTELLKTSTVWTQWHQIIYSYQTVSQIISN